MFNSFKDPLVGAYEHELFVTASINIYEKAASVKGLQNDAIPRLVHPGQMEGKEHGRTY